MSLHCRIHDPSGPRRLRISCAAKHGACVADGAAPTIQRVAAVEASFTGAARNSSASAPLSVAASDSRRTATGSISP